MIPLIKIKRPLGWGRPRWRGWRVVMDNMLIHRGEMIPRGYGVAWRESDRDCSVVMPIPINILASWARRVWHWFRHGVRPSAIDRRITDAYHQGRTDGSNSRLAEFRGQEDKVRMESYEKGRSDAIMAFKLTMELQRIKGELRD